METTSLTLKAEIARIFAQNCSPVILPSFPFYTDFFIFIRLPGYALWSICCKSFLEEEGALNKSIKRTVLERTEQYKCAPGVWYHLHPSDTPTVLVEQMPLLLFSAVSSSSLSGLDA